MVWSPSAIISARTCLMQWHLTYGGGGIERTHGHKRDIPRHLALGMVAHSALEAAYGCARQEYPRAHRPGTMDRYLGYALDALASRWRNLLLPEDDALQAQLIAEVGAVLESLPVPRARAVLAIEEPLLFTGRSGTPFKAIPDLVLMTGRDSIHIRDWKRKSANSLPSKEDLLDDVQLCQLRAAVAERWPWARTVTVGLFSVISCVEVSIELPLERALYQLDGHEVTAHNTETIGMFPTNRGQACGSCAVRPQCPAFKH